MSRPNNVVYVLIGQRGAGKSTYAKALYQRDPTLRLLIRDDISVRCFGSLYFHADKQEEDRRFIYTLKLMFRFLKRTFSSKPGSRVIMEVLATTQAGRRSYIETLQKLGATKIIALCFETPLEIVDQWFWQKPEVGLMGVEKEGEDLLFFTRDTPTRQHEAFQHHLATIDTDGWDQVIRVNPLEPLITLPY